MTLPPPSSRHGLPNVCFPIVSGHGHRLQVEPFVLPIRATLSLVSSGTSMSNQTTSSSKASAWGGISCNVLTGLEGPASGLQADEGHFLKAGFVYFGKNPASCF